MVSDRAGTHSWVSHSLIAARAGVEIRAMRLTKKAIANLRILKSFLHPFGMKLGCLSSDIVNQPLDGRLILLILLDCQGTLTIQAIIIYKDKICRQKKPELIMRIILS